MRSPLRARAALPGVLLGALLALGACGFHPRGSLDALDAPGRLFLDADRGLSIEEALRAALRERAFTLADARDEADVILRVADEHESRRIVSVRSTGRVSEYQLVHSVRVGISRPAAPDTSADAPTDAPTDAAPADVSAADAAESRAAPSGDDPATGVPVPEAPPDVAAVPRRPDLVEVTRDYTYDESQVLGKENEARILRNEMSDELVRQIVLRTVASMARAAAPAPPSPATQ